MIGVLVFFVFIYSLIAIFKPSLFWKFLKSGSMTRKQASRISIGMFLLLIAVYQGR
ncbi:hypothetical protein [Paenibacillus sp. LjRoot56]|uniref:hypothetical protein n=1 Tax=Paenibacillus sp. LjRoot56 TaxID=3342333 RepID=UPI003ECF26D3